jgi:hypothetical protein
MLSYLFNHNALLNSIPKIGLFVFGIFLWTILEYYHHRVLFHPALVAGKAPRDHLIHHAFPELPSKLPLSVTKNLLI